MTYYARVLNTYEILEHIMLHLPLFDLLRSERVSKSFQNVIKRSKSVRTALFREPAIADTTMTFRKPDEVAKRFLYDEYSRWVTAEGDLQQPIISPFVPQFIDFSGTKFILHNGFVDPRVDGGLRDEVSDATEALFRRCASWRTTYMFQTPALEVDFDCMMQIPLYPMGFCAREDGGLTLGQMRRCLVDHWQECPNDPVWHGRPNTWVIDGGENVDHVHDGITGWEMLAEIWRRSPRASSE